MTEELRQALEPFLLAARRIPPHWEGKHALQRQVAPGLYHPTVAQYRDLLAAVDREP